MSHGKKTLGQTTMVEDVGNIVPCRIRAKQLIRNLAWGFGTQASNGQLRLEVTIFSGGLSFNSRGYSS